MTEELKNQEQDHQNEELEQESVEQVDQETPNDDPQPEEEIQDDNSVAEDQGDDETSDEKDEEERKKAEQAFLERRRKQMERQKDIEQKPSENRTQQEKDDLADLRRLNDQIKYQNIFNQVKEEYRTLEKEYAENIRGFSDDIKRAEIALKKRYMAYGLSEGDALQKIEQDKVLHADRAAARNEDPVEAVHKEAKIINQWIDSLAEEFGYTKPKATKTNAQALREASKPNAMSGGLGRGSSATKRVWEDLDDPRDVADVTIGELMKGNA